MVKKINKVFILIKESSMYDIVNTEVVGVYLNEKNANKKKEELEFTEPVTIYPNDDEWYNNYYIWEEDIVDIYKFKKLRKI